MLQPDLNILKLWIAALISGDYEQCHYFLRQTSKHTARGLRERPVPAYCATGVLCELHRQITDNGEWKGQSYLIKGMPEKITRRSISLPPPEVCAWAGFEYNPVHPEQQARRNAEAFLW